MRGHFGRAQWARSIVREIASGVAALHEASVVHRDLKPGNVLFTTGSNGALVAKISDFGISRFGALDTGDGVDPNAATIDGARVRPSALTVTGTLLGTPFYMPPEAARGGRTADAPADVFAFGILACELLTGRAPFAMPALFTAMAGERLPAPVVDGIPEDLRETLTACLAEEASARPSMQQICNALAS
jgi:serine/threonine-protein kinase